MHAPPIFQAPTLMQTPGDRSRKDLHLRAPLNQLHIPLARPDLQGARPQTRWRALATGATPAVRAQGSRQPESRGASVGTRPERPRHKGQDPQPLNSQRAVSSALPLSPAGWEGGQGKPRFQRAGGLPPSPLTLEPTGPARAPAGRGACPAEGGRRRPGAGVPLAVPPSLLPSPRSTTSTKWQSAAPRAERCAGRRDRLGAPDRAQRGDTARPPPPAPAVVRPGRGSGGSPARARPGMRAGPPSR